MSDKELEKIRREKAQALMRELSMPKEILQIRSYQQYSDLLKQYPNKLVVMDLWAEWCAPCKMFAPVFEKLQKEYHNHAIFVKVNVDENQLIAQQYGITGIPTTLFVKNGKVVHKIVGAANYNKVKEAVEKLA